MLFVILTLFLGPVSGEDQKLECFYLSHDEKRREEICPIRSKEGEERSRLWHAQYGVIKVKTNQRLRTENGND